MQHQGTITSAACYEVFWDWTSTKKCLLKHIQQCFLKQATPFEAERIIEQHCAKPAWRNFHPTTIPSKAYSIYLPNQQQLDWASYNAMKNKLRLDISILTQKNAESWFTWAKLEFIIKSVLYIVKSSINVFTPVTDAS